MNKLLKEILKNFDGKGNSFLDVLQKRRERFEKEVNLDNSKVIDRLNRSKVL